MNFQRDFDDLLNTILTDYRNQIPDADTSQGSLIFIKSACLASAMWGLYYYQEWISRQIFPDTADTQYLEHHAWIRGIARTYGETDAAYLSRLLDYIRRPPAGGNKYDYVKWALSIDNVAAAYCFPLAQGLGTVDVVIVANKATTGSEIPSSHAALSGLTTSIVPSKLSDDQAHFIVSGVQKGDRVRNAGTGKVTRVVSIDSNTALTLDADIFSAAGEEYEILSLVGETKAYIDDERPVTASIVRVFGPEIVEQPISMAVTGTDIDRTRIASDIAAYMQTLTPGQTLYLSRLAALAMQNGPDNVIVTIPVADVTCLEYQVIRPGDINVA